MLFCFSEKTSKRLPDKRNRCEIGIHNQTGTDKHAFVIDIKKEPLKDKKKRPLKSGELERVDPKSAEMSANPLEISQVNLRKFSSLHLYTGTLQPQPPTSGSVIRDKSFDGILDLEGEDFYRGKVNVIPGRYTILFATAGSFTGVDATHDAEYARVSERIHKFILKESVRPRFWDNLLDLDRRLLATYFRQVKTEVEIPSGQHLILQGVKKPGEVVTIFRLPHPSVLNAKRYVIEITNLDKKHSKFKPYDKIGETKKCGAFIHHSLAVKPTNPDAKTIFGLTSNFDFLELTRGEKKFLNHRCETACCIVCKLESSTTIYGGG